MNARKRGWILALVHVLLVASIGAKFLIDRANYPRVWIATLPVDPDLPIRGRYVQLRAIVEAPDSGACKTGPKEYCSSIVRLMVRDGALHAVDDKDAHQRMRPATCDGNPCWALSEPLAYFIPEHVADPSRRAAGEQLWVEASIPPNGPPRPIRLGVKANGVIKAIDL